MAWNGPPWAVPGRRSKVSLWLGPPSIHKRMQDLCCALVSAARVASTLNQPDTEVPRIPAADSLSKSRRESCGVMSAFLLFWSRLQIVDFRLQIENQLFQFQPKTGL